MAKKLHAFLMRNGVLKKGAAQEAVIPCKFSASNAPRGPAEGFYAHPKPIVMATITEKIREKSRSFDRYILRYFAILQCEF
jgi:hypothetical protein